jgi:hypothetical protein
MDVVLLINGPFVVVIEMIAPLATEAFLDGLIR